MEAVEPAKTQQRFLLYSRKQELMSPECSVPHYHRHQQKLGLEMLISQGEIISHSQPGVQFKMIDV